MKLTQTQIIELKNIIAEKGIGYADVQMEILDHVASAIEDRMSADQQLTFENAIVQTNASFGIFGFSALEDSIVLGMNRKYRKIFWTQFQCFFAFKYIGLVALAAFLVYYAQVLINNYIAVIVCLVTTSFILLAALVFLKFKLRRYKVLLVYNVSMGYTGHISSFALVLNCFISQIPLVIIYGVNINLVLSTIVLLLFLIYVFASIRTALHGIKESKELNIKYLQLAY